MDKEPTLKDIFQPAALSKEEQEVFFSIYDNKNFDDPYQQNEQIKMTQLKDVVSELIVSVNELSKRVNDVQKEILQIQISEEPQLMVEEKITEDKSEEIQMSRIQKYKKVSFLKKMMRFFESPNKRSTKPK